MSSVEQQLATRLLANSALTALVGTRIYRVQIPQGPTLPCLAYQRISTARQYEQDLKSFGWCRFQFTILAGGASGMEAAATIATALKTALEATNVAPHTALNQATVMNERETLEAQTQQPLGKRILDAKIWFSD